MRAATACQAQTRKMVQWEGVVRHGVAQIDAGIGLFARTDPLKDGACLWRRLSLGGGGGRPHVP
jgi:hypothetical protein